MNITETKDKLELVIEKKQFEKVEKLLHSIKPHNGHKLFEYNLVSGEIKIAEFEILSINFINARKKDFSKRKKVIRKDNCIYLPALNVENVKKHLRKIFIEKK